MDEGLDTGDMLLKKVCPIDANETSQSLHDKLEHLGAQAIVEALKKIEIKELSHERQDAQLATYAAKLTKSEAQLDWKKDAVELERAIRGYFPYPVAQTNLGETTIKIIRAHLEMEKTGKPGTIIAVESKRIIIACGSGALALDVLQRSGGKPLQAAQFMQGFPVKVGDRFGSI
jgi:methionyl-tRNA formyltransferase